MGKKKKPAPKPELLINRINRESTVIPPSLEKWVRIIRRNREKEIIKSVKKEKTRTLSCDDKAHQVGLWMKTAEAIDIVNKKLENDPLLSVTKDSIPDELLEEYKQYADSIRKRADAFTKLMQCIKPVYGTAKCFDCEKAKQEIFAETKSQITELFAHADLVKGFLRYYDEFVYDEYDIFWDDDIDGSEEPEIYELDEEDKIMEAIERFLDDVNEDILYSICCLTGFGFSGFESGYDKVLNEFPELKNYIPEIDECMKSLECYGYTMSGKDVFDKVINDALERIYGNEKSFEDNCIEEFGEQLNQGDVIKLLLTNPQITENEMYINIISTYQELKRIEREAALRKAELAREKREQKKKARKEKKERERLSRKGIS